MKQKFCAQEYKELLSTTTDILCCPKVPIPQINKDQNYIFISYAHSDFRQVYADLADMYEAGVRFWYDRGLSAGKKWNAEVKEKIEHPNCVGVIFYMSENLFRHLKSAGQCKNCHKLFCCEFNQKVSQRNTFFCDAEPIR